MTLAQAMITGFISGAVASGSLQGGLIGAFSAGLFYGIGSAFGKMAAANGGSLSAGQTLGKILAHGLAGGVMSVLQGGKFGDGFLAAGVTQAFAPGIDKIGAGKSWGVAARITAAAVLGGTTSVLSGGKFANGAITAAFSRTFNDEIHLERSNAMRNAVIRAKNAVLRFFGKEDVLVIGEAMKDRVIPYAKKNGHDWYGPKTDLPLGYTDEQMAASIDENIKFVIEKMDQGYTIIDIGPQQGRANYPLPTSPWYMAEVVHVWTRNNGVPYEFLRTDKQPSHVDPH